MQNAFDGPYLGMTGEFLKKEIAREHGSRPADVEYRPPQAPKTSAATANVLHCLATAMHRQRRFNEAESLYRQAIALIDQPGEHHFRLSAYLYNLAGLCTQMGRYKEAETLLLRSVDVAEEHIGAAHPKTMRRRVALLRVQRRMEKTAGAEKGGAEAEPITW